MLLKPKKILFSWILLFTAKAEAEGEQQRLRGRRSVASAPSLAWGGAAK